MESISTDSTNKILKLIHIRDFVRLVLFRATPEPVRDSSTLELLSAYMNVDRVFESFEQFLITWESYDAGQMIVECAKNGNMVAFDRALFEGPIKKDKMREAITEASKSGFNEIVEILLSLQPYDEKKHFSYSIGEAYKAAKEAVSRNNIELMRILLSTDVELYDSENESSELFAVAAENGNIDMLQLLLEIDIPLHDFFGMNSALSVAIKNIDKELINFLISRRVSLRPINYYINDAIKDNNIDGVKLLSKLTPSAKRYIRNDFYALWLAVEKGNYEIAKYLVEQGATVRRELKYNAFLTAVEANDLKMIKLLYNVTDPETVEIAVIRAREAQQKDVLSLIYDLSE